MQKKTGNDWQLPVIASLSSAGGRRPPLRFFFGFVAAHRVRLHLMSPIFYLHAAHGARPHTTLRYRNNRNRPAFEVQRQIPLNKTRKRSLFTLCHFQSLQVGLFIFNSDHYLETFLSAQKTAL